MSDALTFLQAVWSTKPDTTAVQLWRKSDQMTYSFAAIEPASDWIGVNGDSCDVYMAAGLAAREANAARRRANKGQVVGIPGVWADIDVNGGPEGKTGAAKSITEAHSLAEHLLQPTLLVNSGYGLQAWWLLDAVLPFHTENERDHAQKVVRGFQGALKDEAKTRGYSIDSTFDLARLMRVPGSRNHKGIDPVVVDLLDDGGPRYSLASLEEVGREFQTVAASKIGLITGESIDIELNPQAEPPYSKVQLLIDEIPEFVVPWNHVKNRKTANWSMSEFEYSITNYLVQAGWSDQEICDALVYHRNRFEPGDPKGKNRVERLAQTIGKVRATSAVEAEAAEFEFEQQQTIDQIVAISKDAGMAPGVTVSLFNRIIDVSPAIKRLVQSSRDPATCRYHLELEDGTEVPLGNVDQFTNLRTFKNNLIVVSNHVAKIPPKKWESVIEALLKVAVVKENPDDNRRARAIAWVRDYCDQRISTDKDQACENSEPFLFKDAIHLQVDPMIQFMRRMRGHKIDEADLRQYLEAAGFTQRTINYTRRSGRASTRSYYSLSHAEFGDPLL